ncbi:MAG: heme-binding protein [Pseudomonadota bacterium]
MLNLKALTAISSLLFATHLAQAEVTYTESFISLDPAKRLAERAMTHCAEHGFSVAVTVVDARAQLKSLLVADGAFPHAVETSIRKAKTAASRRLATHLVVDKNDHEPTLADTFHAIGLTTLGGGTPIIYNKQVIGGIGIAGAPGEDASGKDFDLACLEKAYADMGFDWPQHMNVEEQ